MWLVAKQAYESSEDTCLQVHFAMNNVVVLLGNIKRKGKREGMLSLRSLFVHHMAEKEKAKSGPPWHQSPQNGSADVLKLELTCILFTNSLAFFYTFPAGKKVEWCLSHTPASPEHSAGRVTFSSLWVLYETKLIQFLYCILAHAEQCLELHRGQGMEIYWRDNYICPTEAEYSRMVKRSKQISLLIALSSSPYTCFTHSTLKFASRNWGSFWTSGEVNAALQWQQKVKLVDFCGLPVFLFW